MASMWPRERSPASPGARPARPPRPGQRARAVGAVDRDGRHQRGDAARESALVGGRRAVEGRPGPLEVRAAPPAAGRRRTRGGRAPRRARGPARGRRRRRRDPRRRPATRPTAGGRPRRAGRRRRVRGRARPAGVEPQPGGGGVGARRGFGLAPGARLGRQRGVAPRRAGDAVREPGRARPRPRRLPGGGPPVATAPGPRRSPPARAGGRRAAPGRRGCRPRGPDRPGPPRPARDSGSSEPATSLTVARGAARPSTTSASIRRRAPSEHPAMRARTSRAYDFGAGRAAAPASASSGSSRSSAGDVERVAAGVRLQAVRSAGRQGSSEPGRQRLDGVTVEPGQLDAGAPVVRLGQPDEPGRQAVHLVEPAGDHQDDAIRPEAAGGEGQRLEGRTVGPVGIVDHDDERIGQLGLVDEPQQRPAGVERIGPRRGHQARDRVGVERRGRGQSLDHAVVDPGLGGIARHRHHRGVGSTQQRRPPGATSRRPDRR